MFTGNPEGEWAYCRNINRGPCPITAHPITNVVLTSLGDDPDQFLIGNEFSVLHRPMGSDWSSPCWPGVTFRFTEPLESYQEPPADSVASSSYANAMLDLQQFATEVRRRTGGSE
jgi:hypothetical protein